MGDVARALRWEAGIHQEGPAARHEAMIDHHLQQRVRELRARIHPLVQEAMREDCSAGRREALIAQLRPLYEALFAIHQEMGES